MYVFCRYGMRLLRDNADIRNGVCMKKEDIVEEEEDRKLVWERDHLKSMEEEMMVSEELITYTSDLVDRVWRSESGDTAEVWRPRGHLQTPDTVGPESVWSGYSKELIPDTDLPPVHVKKEKKNNTPLPIAGVICQAMSPPTPGSGQMSPSSALENNRSKMRREDQMHNTPPRSLFDRPRPFKMVPKRPPGHSSVSLASSLSSTNSLSSTFSSLKPMLRDSDAGPEWTIQEDWTLHQSVTSVQELTLAAMSPSAPGHLVNWDMVSDMVNAVSWCYRSGKQCRARWESSLVPREEGRPTYDLTPKKLKKDKKLGIKPEKRPVTAHGQSLKTAALYKNDNNNAISSTFSSRFETIKSIANKRTPTTTPLLVNPTQRNPKHAAVLAEYSIDYDTPVSPIQVAANRAERIQATKARTAQLAAVQSAAAGQLQSAGAGAAGSVTVGLPQSPVCSTQIRSQNNPSVTVSLPNQPAQAVVVGISQPLQQNSGTVTRPVQQSVTALSVQDLLKTVSSSSGHVMSTNSTARLGSSQILVSQAGKSGAPGQAGTIQVANQRLTPQQLAMLKQQALNKKAQEQAKLARLSAVSSGGSIVTTTVSGASIVTTTAANNKVMVTGGVQSQSKPGQPQPQQQQQQQVINRQNVRNITDPEFKALLAKQGAGVKVGQGGVVQVSANSMTAAQLQQLGIQVASSSGPATLVKTVSAPAGQPGTSKTVAIGAGQLPAGVNLQGGQIKAVTAVTAGRGTTIKGSPQQIQQLGLQQLKLLQQKGALQGGRVAVQTGGKGIPTQLIVPGGNKGLPGVTVQQLQQIVKVINT